MRHCPFDNCGKRIPAEMFACRSHWYALSQSQRNEIWTAWYAYQVDPLALVELRRRQNAVLVQAGQTPQEEP
jgi:hypothetical protein